MISARWRHSNPVFRIEILPGIFNSQKRQNLTFNGEGAAGNAPRPVRELQCLFLQCPDPIRRQTRRARAFRLTANGSFSLAKPSREQLPFPRPGETAFPALHGKAGTAIYQRTFTVPESFQGKTVLLSFGAVDYFTEVWVNGVPLGSHEGGYTPFAFPIEAALSGYGPDAIQSLVVRVTDSTLNEDAKLPNNKILPFAEIPHGKQSWYTSIGGIWQSVYLEARNKTHIERACFLPDIDAGTAQVEIRVVGLKNAYDWKARIVIDAPKGAGAIESQVLPLTQGQSENGVLTLTTTLTVPNAALWCPDAPNLYNVLVTLEQDGEVEDAFHTRFGMRKIESKEGRVWLNNHPYFLIGALDQAFYPQTIYTPPSEDYLRDQFMKAKEMGLNLMRCHIKVPTPSYLELCDEIGLLVWYEIPNGAKLSLPFRDRAKQTLTNMWNRDANHPCLVIATIMNESWGIDLNDGEQRVWLRETYRWAKTLCKSWLVVDNFRLHPELPCGKRFRRLSYLFQHPRSIGRFRGMGSVVRGPDGGNVYGIWRRRISPQRAASYFRVWELGPASCGQNFRGGGRRTVLVQDRKQFRPAEQSARAF